MIGLYIYLPQLLNRGNTSQTNNFNLIKPKPSPTPTPSPGLTPVTLIIPKLKIQAAIESVGLTETNNMDVPKNAGNAAWYVYGSKPGELGSAVIAGHYDTPTGKPALFYQLNKLEIGDQIEVISENAVRNTFAVVEKATIPYDKFPNEQVFKTKEGKNLNLITCAGIWDAKEKIYKDRIVVYTALVEPNAFMQKDESKKTETTQ